MSTTTKKNKNCYDKRASWALQESSCTLQANGHCRRHEESCCFLEAPFSSIVFSRHASKSCRPTPTSSACWNRCHKTGSSCEYASKVLEEPALGFSSFLTLFFFLEMLSSVRAVDDDEPLAGTSCEDSDPLAWAFFKASLTHVARVFICCASNSHLKG